MVVEVYIMGFFDRFFRKEEEKTATEKKAEEMIKENPEFSHVGVENIPKCNGCGMDIEGTPRIKNYGGKVMYFHKRCWKSLKKGQLPKPL